MGYFYFIALKYINFLVILLYWQLSHCIASIGSMGQAYPPMLSTFSTVLLEDLNV